MLSANHSDNTITVRLKSGREITYNPERLSGVAVYKEAKRQFAEGDRIQFRAPFAEAKVKNSELGTITEIADSKLTVALAGKRVITFDPEKFPHLDHGYAVTSYSAQGKTMDRVLVNAETTETDLLLNQRMAYVAISRARFDARVYTDSAVDLGGALNRPKDKEMALEALKESQTGTPAFDKPSSIARAKPRELKQLARDSCSISRLKGSAIVAGSNVAVAEKQTVDFEKSRHFANFEINGEHWSLVSLDRQQRIKEREIDFNKRTVSAYRMRLYGVIHNPIKLYNIRDYKERAAKAKVRIKQSREEIKQLQPIRERVTDFIEERPKVLRENVEQERQLSRTFNSALAVEVDLHINQSEGIPQTEFNATEVDQLEANATNLRDCKMLDAAQNYLAQHYGDARDGLEKIAARAVSVEESAKASLRSAGERIRSFVENREFFPVLFKAVDGSEKTATLNELAPNTFGEKVVSYLSISERLDIAAVQEALNQHHRDLLQERDTFQQFTQRATEIAQSYRENLQTLNPVITQAQSTTQDVTQIESFAAEETITSLGTSFQELTVSATNGDGISGINNLAQQSAGNDRAMAHQHSTADDHLEQARKTLDKVSAESVAANETGMWTGLAADTDAAGSEAWAALL